MKEAIFEVLKYFSFFDYPPTFEEIYTFLPEKTTKKELKKEIDYLIGTKIIKKLKLKIENSSRYTIGEYSKKVKNYSLKLKISQRKIKNLRFKLYIKLLSLFPQIKLVGLSGSLAMMNADEDDDIDLFIITAKNRLFTGRFIAVILAQILGIRRKRIKESPRHHIFLAPSTSLIDKLSKRLTQKQVSLLFKNKVCLNLFFDEFNLEVPDFKKNEYVAHEILQMKPLLIKDNIYRQFLKANRWVLNFFPNVRLLLNSKLEIKNSRFSIFILRFGFLTLSFITEKIEKILKRLQIYLINRHKTTEIITSTQLWFHPDDFQRKIKKKS